MTNVGVLRYNLLVAKPHPSKADMSKNIGQSERMVEEQTVFMKIHKAVGEVFVNALTPKDYALQNLSSEK